MILIPKADTVPWASNFEVQSVLEHLKKEEGLRRKVASTGLWTFHLNPDRNLPLCPAKCTFPTKTWETHPQVKDDISIEPKAEEGIAHIIQSSFCLCKCELGSKNRKKTLIIYVAWYTYLERFSWKPDEFLRRTWKVWGVLGRQSREGWNKLQRVP